MRPPRKDLGVYDALIAAHVVCAEVGFGDVALSGVYGGLAGRPGPQGDRDAVRDRRTEGPPEEIARYFASGGWAEWLIVPVPLLGAAALAMRPSKGDFAAVWVVGGIVIWTLAVALLLLVVRPAESSIRRQEPALRAGRRLMWSSIASDVLFVAALALMVTQPR